jgi:hypothetical protein
MVNLKDLWSLFPIPQLLPNHSSSDQFLIPP